MEVEPALEGIKLFGFPMGATASSNSEVFEPYLGNGSFQSAPSMPPVVRNKGGRKLIDPRRLAWRWGRPASSLISESQICRRSR